MAIRQHRGAAIVELPLKQTLHREILQTPRPISKNNAYWHQVVRHPIAQKIKDIDINDGTLMSFNGQALCLFNATRVEYQLNHPALEATILQWCIEHTAYGKYMQAAIREGLLTKEGMSYAAKATKHGQRAERLLVTITDINARLSKDRAAAAALAAKTITVEGTSQPVKSEWDDDEEEETDAE